MLNLKKYAHFLVLLRRKVNLLPTVSIFRLLQGPIAGSEAQIRPK